MSNFILYHNRSIYPFSFEILPSTCCFLARISKIILVGGKKDIKTHLGNRCTFRKCEVMKIKSGWADVGTRVIRYTVVIAFRRKIQE